MLYFSTVTRINIMVRFYYEAMGALPWKYQPDIHFCQERFIRIRRVACFEDFVSAEINIEFLFQRFFDVNLCQV